MKLSTALAITLAVVVFMGVVVVATLQRAQYDCVVCLQFSQGEICRAGSGPTREEAMQAAQESVCGGNTSGMAEIIACRNATPSSYQCN
ncbi:MAG: hypothetical protein EA422_03050 [Gemmatimonadales bacterium]|nr:MAG: hypothetical protein EA422_03050 [Gemmatimonadales bacterium]